MMTTGSLITFLVIALVDSINPSALIVTLQLLGRKAPVPAILVYLGSVFVTYLSVGILLVLGLTAMLDPLTAFMETRAANIALTVLGGGMLAYALFSRKPKEGREPRQIKLGAAATSGLVLLGVSVTIMELPTALPLLGAVGLLTSAELDWFAWLPLLLVYNVIFILPPLILTFGYRWLGQRGGDRLEQQLLRGARETMLWIVGIIGFYLLLLGLDALGILGDSISVGTF